MQVSTAQREVAAAPGSAPRILVKVVNTGTIIDGLSARLIGVGGAEVHTEPAMLPLFPEAEGEFALTVALPENQPAGRHPLTVEVLSHTTGSIQHADVDLDVSAHPAFGVAREPRMIRARRSGRFVLAIGNQGNVPLEVMLSSVPGDAGTSVRLTPSSVRVEPGTTVSAIAVVRGPRMVTGSEIDRTAGVEIVAVPTGNRPDGPDDPDDYAGAEQEQAVQADAALTQTTSLQLRQRPLISRGLMTFLILAAVVALWAAIFLFGLINVFAGDPLTKTAPASLFTTSAATGSEDGGAGDGGGTGAQGGAGAAGAPADALPKKGLLPPGVGGQIAGAVTARSDDTPVGRILVEAYRTGPEDRLIKVSSGATQSDGSYTLAGLFPTSYKLKFSAKGFRTVWYGDTRRPGGAEEVLAEAQGSIDGIDVVIGGKEGSITGVVDPGDSLRPVPTQVSARLLSSAGDQPVAARAVTDATGRYELTGLRAPGTYEIGFVAPGYRATSVVQKLRGGEQRIQPKVLLSAGGGQVAGVVSGEKGPLGGVTVTTTVDGEARTVITPTTGNVGAYSLQDLPTPGTYVVTFTADGHGSRTSIVDLGPGQSRTNYDQRLTAGTGSVSGVVRGPGGAGLGGVEITVGGAASEGGTAPTTTSLTTGTVGSFAFSNLPAPGNYTLTFTAPGYAPETRPVTLKADGPAVTVDLRLSTRLGSLTGLVSRPGGGLIVGATVTATNGMETFRTTSSGRGGALPDGGYLIPGLAPGWYSVTAAVPGRIQQTALVQVRSGPQTKRDLVLRESP